MALRFPFLISAGQQREQLEEESFLALTQWAASALT